MPNPWFRFKQFTVHQDRCAMKVGTDGVLLGAWACHGEPKHVLDIGTGTGLLALIAAQRCPSAVIDAVELDPEAAAQARDNAAASPWPARIHVREADVLKWQHAETYNLILCNPPFYKGHRTSQDVRMAAAKHEDLLDLGALLPLIVRCMAKKGRACLVFPVDRLDDLRTTAARCGLAFARVCRVCYVAGQSAKRVLVELVHEPGDAQAASSLTVQLPNGQFTPEYKALLRDLELHF